MALTGQRMAEVRLKMAEIQVTRMAVVRLEAGVYDDPSSRRMRADGLQQLANKVRGSRSVLQ
jgi:hypothetical protein